MIKELCLVFCLVLSCAFVAAAEDPRLERLEAFIDDVDRLGLSPSYAVVVVRGEEVVHLGARGYADLQTRRVATADTVYYIASATKPFTGLLAALLDSEGRWDLDGSIADYLPNASLAAGLSADDVSVRDLLTHTHGISNDGPVTFRSAYAGAADHEAMVAMIAAHPPAEKGRRFRYSNVGYNIAGLAMRQELDLDWKEGLASRVFAPLGMRSTTARVSEVEADRLALPYRPDPVGFSSLHYSKADVNMHAAGGMVTTARDLGNWLMANLGRGRLGGETVLPEAAFAEAHRRQVRQRGEKRIFGRDAYGLGWNVGEYEGERMLHHFGGFTGFYTHVSFLPEASLGVAVVTNSMMGSLPSDAIARYAYDLLLEKPDLSKRGEALLRQAEAAGAALRGRIAEDRARRAARPQQPRRPLEAYAGVYENPHYGRARFEIVSNGLQVSMGPLWSEVEVYDAERDAMRVELTGSGAVIEFHFGDGERAEKVTQGPVEFRRVE